MVTRGCQPLRRAHAGAAARAHGEGTPGARSTAAAALPCVDHTMISQLFILAPNGHTIVHKDYRGEVPKDAPETFLRKVVEKTLDGAPIFQVDGVNYMCVRKNGLFFLCTTVYNVSPAFVIELLTQLTKVCKDYIGVLTEESLRKNFTLIYELVDEIIDFGYPQSASTAELQAFVFNEAAPVANPKESKLLPSLKPTQKTMVRGARAARTAHARRGPSTPSPTARRAAAPDARGFPGDPIRLAGSHTRRPPSHPLARGAVFQGGAQADLAAQLVVAIRQERDFRRRNRPHLRHLQL
eukprot:3223084-Prymnesium_polylepis.3